MTRRILAGTILWTLPIGLVLLYTMGLLVMMAFALLVGAGTAVVAHRRTGAFSAPAVTIVAVVSLIIAGVLLSFAGLHSATVPMEALPREEAVYSVELSVCVSPNAVSEQEVELPRYGGHRPNGP